MEPIRTCVGCKAKAPQSELIRFIVSDGEIVEATHPRTRGRGAYLHDDQRCRLLAMKRRAVPRALKLNSL